MTDTLPGVLSRRGRFEQAYAECVLELSRLAEAELEAVDLDAFEAVTTALCTWPTLRRLSPLITQMKGVDRAQLERIERYAYATAHVEVRLRALQGEDVEALHARALVFQDTLCAATNLLPPDAVARTDRSRAPDVIGHDLAWRAIRAQEHLGPHLPEAQAFEPLYRVAVEAELHAELLLACLCPPTDVGRAELEAGRTRALHLLIGAYEPASEAARRLFRDRSQVDALAHAYALSQVAETFGSEALRYFEPGHDGTRSN